MLIQVIEGKVQDADLMRRQKLALVVNGSAPVGDRRMNGFSPVRMILFGSAAMFSSREMRREPQV